MNEELMTKIERIEHYRELIYSITKDKKEQLDSVEITFGKKYKDEENWSKIWKTKKFENFVQEFYYHINHIIYGIETIEDEKKVYNGIGFEDEKKLNLKIIEENKNKNKVLIQKFNALQKFLEKRYPSFDLSRIHEDDSLGKEIQRMKKNPGMKETEFRGMLKDFYAESCDFFLNCYEDECSKIEKEIDPEVIEKEEQEEQEEQEERYRDPLVDALIFAFGFVILLVIVDLFV